MSQVTGDASGLPVNVVGSALLQVRFTPAAGHNAKGTITYGTMQRTYALPELIQVVNSGDFESVLSFGVGLAQKASGNRQGTRGAPAGLLAGGLLVTYASWRWVLFVNVPIGIGAALAALVVLPGTARTPGRFDLPGIVTGTGGVAALVYGLSSAATSPDGTSHWGDAKVIAALTAGAVLLAAFAFAQARSRHALLPVWLLRSRDRLGANLMMLGAGTTLFGVFFFLTLFVRDVWGYSGLLGPILVTGAGLGLLFVPVSLVALARVGEADSGVAASLLNTGRQVGGSIGLAVLGTVAWTVVANSARAQATEAARAASPVSPAPAGRTTATLQAAAHQHALAAGFDRAFLVAAGIALLCWWSRPP